MSQQNVQAARDLYEAFARGDMVAFEKGCAPAIIWNEAENSLYSAGNPYRSFAAVRDQVFQPVLRDFDNFRLEVDKILDAGDFVIGFGRYRGRHTKTGKELKAQFCHILQLDRQGKLNAIQEYTDTLNEAEVAGRVQPVAKARQPEPAI